MKKKIALGVGLAFVVKILYDLYWTHMEDHHQGDAPTSYREDYGSI